MIDRHDFFNAGHRFNQGPISSDIQRTARQGAFTSCGIQLSFSCISSMVDGISVMQNNNTNQPTPIQTLRNEIAALSTIERKQYNKIWLSFALVAALYVAVIAVVAAFSYINQNEVKDQVKQARDDVARAKTDLEEYHRELRIDNKDIRNDLKDEIDNFRTEKNAAISDFQKNEERLDHEFDLFKNEIRDQSVPSQILISSYAGKNIIGTVYISSASGDYATKQYRVYVDFSVLVNSVGEGYGSIAGVITTYSTGFYQRLFAGDLNEIEKMPDGIVANATSSSIITNSPLELNFNSNSAVVPCDEAKKILESLFNFKTPVTLTVSAAAASSKISTPSSTFIVVLKKQTHGEPDGCAY